MKNATELKGNWNETKGILKQKFAMLTDNDLLLVEGKHFNLEHIYKISQVLEINIEEFFK